MKQPGVINLKYLPSLADDIRFHQDLQQSNFIGKQVFFDTSSILELLMGIQSIFKANHFNRSVFNLHVTLLYGMAYRNWLGEIFTLPAHTDELVSKIQNPKGLLSNLHQIDAEAQENELWNTIGINQQDLQIFNEDKETILQRFNQLKIDSVEVFKATFLIHNGGNWKRRYKFLRDQKTINFSPSADLNINEISKREVYSRLKNYFNHHRHNYGNVSNHKSRSINNYVDVLALCTLDQRLREYESDISKECKLPIFFSDQEIILEAVKAVSQKKDEFGRYPFTWTSSEGRPYSIVRSANFFIIESLFNYNKSSSDQGVLAKFTEALDEYRRTLENYSNASGGAILNFKDKFHKDALNVIFLEFFNRWRTECGNDEMLRLVSEENYQMLDKEIEYYIIQERKRLKEEFTLDSSRFHLVKKMWDVVVDWPKLIHEVFNETNSYYVSKEIDPRFAFKEEICIEIQNDVNDIFHAVHHGDHLLLEDTQSRVINYVLSGLYDVKMDEKERYYELYKGLGILWVFEGFDLINEICRLISSEYKNGKFGVIQEELSNQYPAPSIALIHAASIIQGNSKDQAACLKILNCIEQKYPEDNYQVWIGLSYVYFILWNEVISSYDFYEISKIHSKKVPDFAHEYLKKAGMYAYQAMQWLEEERFNPNALDKQKRRQRRYYYALNNYLFYLIIASNSDDFLKSRSIAKKLEDAAYASDYWQVRFGDTLARYYYRFAFLSGTEAEFGLYLKWAIDYNSQAIKSSQRVREYYVKLEKDLEELFSKGFAKNYAFRFSEGNNLELSFH